MIKKNKETKGIMRWDTLLFYIFIIIKFMKPDTDPWFKLNIAWHSWISDGITYLVRSRSYPECVDLWTPWIYGAQNSI